MFGALCEIDPMRKRVKRGTPDDSASIKSLVRRMKRELDAIPTFKKLALLEAQETAEEREFSERRMELFLRREKLNVERASLRFVKYWEERRKLFGPSKFHLPLTLSGAMRDDVVALEKGVFHLVPGLDDSGRQVTVYIKRRHNRENYDTQSMVRVVWFFHELSAFHPKAANGIVRLMYAVGATMWDIDLELEWMVTNLEQTAWPIPVRCNHGCCPPRLMAMLMRPIGIAQVDRDTRARVVFHDVPEDQLVEVLSDYGISAHLIPKEMGGFCEFGYRNIKPKLQRKLEEKLLQCEEFDWAEL